MSLAETLAARFAASADLPQPFGADSVPFEGEFSAAAVLAAIVDRPEPTVLLTRRNDRLRRHPGQVAFPGGRADPGDAGPIATALREAEEEIALPPDAVTVIGVDAPYRTISGYAIAPVVGVIAPDLPLRAREAEVAEIFEVPLAFLLDPLNRIDREDGPPGTRRRWIEFRYDRHRVWGATAAMIVNLARRIGDG